MTKEITIQAFGDENTPWDRFTQEEVDKLEVELSALLSLRKLALLAMKDEEEGKRGGLIINYVSGSPERTTSQSIPFNDPTAGNINGFLDVCIIVFEKKIKSTIERLSDAKLTEEERNQIQKAHMEELGKKMGDAINEGVKAGIFNRDEANGAIEMVHEMACQGVLSSVEDTSKMLSFILTSGLVRVSRIENEEQREILEDAQKKLKEAS